MPKQNALKPFSEAIRQNARELFRTAYVITGDYSSAEEALKEALFRTYISGKPLMPHAVETVKDAAFRRTDGIPSETEDIPEDGSEGLNGPDRRVMLMYRGLRLKKSEIAYALGRKTGEIRRIIDRIEKTYSDEELTLRCESELRTLSEQAPDAGTLIRTLEMDISGLKPKRHPLRKAFRLALTGLGCALLAALVLLLVILVEPS